MLMCLALQLTGTVRVLRQLEVSRRIKRAIFFTLCRCSDIVLVAENKHRLRVTDSFILLRLNNRALI